MSGAKPIADSHRRGWFHRQATWLDLLVREGFRVHIADKLVGGRLLNIEHHKGNPMWFFENRDIQDAGTGGSDLPLRPFCFSLRRHRRHHPFYRPAGRVHVH